MAIDLARYCWVCEGTFAQPFPTRGDLTEVDCTTCGRYDITGSLLAARFPIPDSERYRFSFWSKRRTLEGSSVLLSNETINAIIANLPNPATHEKPDILLVSLALVHPKPGEYFSVDQWRERSLSCAHDQTEAGYFLKCLIADHSYIESKAVGCQITNRGWERVATLSTNGGALSKAAFVAMAFNTTMLPLWDAVFSPAIKRAGYEPRLANNPMHNDQIDARIVAELKQCRFVVADVTGANTGVYFEAGYALGLGRPVIWTCQNDSRKDMHFDTRQYNHILWEDAESLSEQLYYRIVATI